MISLCVAVALSAAPAARPAGFWEWVQKNEARLADAAAKDPVPVMKEVQEALDRQEQEDELIVELSLAQPPAIIISADGNSAQFGAVKRVVAAAPKLKRWSVIAFRPRRPFMGELEVEDSKFKLSDFSFRELGRVAGKVDVEIAVKGRNRTNADQVDKAAFLVLDTVLGEYDTETKLGVIDFVNKPTKAHRPLEELAAVVDKVQ